MLIFLSSLKEAFNSIRLIISGDTILPRDPDLKKWTLEIYDIYEIPNTRNDRKNLKQDSDVIIDDYKKALEKKKFELNT